MRCHAVRRQSCSFSDYRVRSVLQELAMISLSSPTNLRAVIDIPDTRDGLLAAGSASGEIEAM